MIRVNGAIVPHAAIAREVQNQAGATPLEAWEGATRALVVRELLLQRAGVLGIAAAPQEANGARETEDEAIIRSLLDRELRVPVADEATCRRFHAAHRGKLGAMPFGQAQPLIADYLHDAAWCQAVAQYVTLLAAQARIEGIRLGDATASGTQ